MEEERGDDVYTSIRCRKSTKLELNSIKIHKRETDEDVILRLIEVYKRYQKAMVEKPTME